MESFAITSLGCKVNNFEANATGDLLIKAGFKYSDDVKNADIIIIFTCAVTNVAESKTRKIIRQLKRNNPKAFIVAVGCYVQVANKEILAQLPIDLVVGSNQKANIVSIIQKALNHDIDSYQITPLDTLQFQDLGAAINQSHVRANLKIQDGCNQFCSYCIIPYARGREVCLPFAKVIEQCDMLAKNHGEIVLTGIHTGRYRDNDKNLADVLDTIATKNPFTRFRISSIEINEVSDQLIEVIKKHENIARHLHIPLQAGCDNTLKNMHRPYTCQQYLQRLQYIRQQIKDIAISTDYIVGFVGESDQDYLDSLAFIKQCDFSFMHIFPYSRKKGTLADSMDNHIDEKIKKQRCDNLLTYNKQLSSDFYKKHIGQTVSIIVEEYKDLWAYGYTSDYCYVKVNGLFTIGSSINVTIVDNISNEILIGKKA